MQSRIRLPNGHIVDAGWLLANLGLPPAQALLAEAWAWRARPVCLCQDPPLGLYIRRLAGPRFTLARMPGTRQLHAPDCRLFFAEPTLRAGRDSAIRVREGGRIDVDLTPELLDGGTGSTTFAHRLDAGALLRLLWTEARLNLWQGADLPHWDQVRSRLLDAAGRMLIDMTVLSDRLFLPAAWNESARDRLRDEAENWMRQLANGKRTGLVLGLARRIDTGWRQRDGHPPTPRYRAHLQHFGMPFALDAQAYEQCRVAADGVWQPDLQPPRREGEASWIWPRESAAGRLVVLMKVRVSEWRTRFFLSAGPVGTLRVSSAFIPGQAPGELLLADAMVAERRIFHKPLAPMDGRFAFAEGYELLDCGDQPLPLYAGVTRPLPPRLPRDASVS